MLYGGDCRSAQAVVDVMPAKAGIQFSQPINWTPACAGVTIQNLG
jgi:hypothetical protein